MQGTAILVTLILAWASNDIALNQNIGLSIPIRRAAPIFALKIVASAISPLPNPPLDHVVADRNVAISAEGRTPADIFTHGLIKLHCGADGRDVVHPHVLQIRVVSAPANPRAGTGHLKAANGHIIALFVIIPAKAHA